MSEFTVSQFSAFLQTIKQEGFVCFLPEAEESTVIHKHAEGFLLEFVIQYTSHRKNYLPATHDNPEEYDLEHEVTGFSEVIVYKDEEPVELTEEELLSIESVLESILY